MLRHSPCGLSCITYWLECHTSLWNTSPSYHRWWSRDPSWLRSVSWWWLDNCWSLHGAQGASLSCPLHVLSWRWKPCRRRKRNNRRTLQLVHTKGTEISISNWHFILVARQHQNTSHATCRPQWITWCSKSQEMNKHQNSTPGLWNETFASCLTQK